MLYAHSISTHLLNTCYARLARYALGRGEGFCWSFTTSRSGYECQDILQQISCAAVTLTVSHCDECGFETQQANLVELDETGQHTLR